MNLVIMFSLSLTIFYGNITASYIEAYIFTGVTVKNNTGFNFTVPAVVTTGAASWQPTDWISCILL